MRGTRGLERLGALLRGANRHVPSWTQQNDRALCRTALWKTPEKSRQWRRPRVAHRLARGEDPPRPRFWADDEDRDRQHGETPLPHGPRLQLRLPLERASRPAALLWPDRA